MRPEYYVIGRVALSNTAHSVKVYVLSNGQWDFLGLMRRRELEALLKGQVTTVDICRFRTATAQETIL